MFKRSTQQFGYQRGGWKPGSKHQKHMGLNPTLYLYRFPGPRGPGPYTMKYWWTLGTFPTGMEVPFRLKEFLATYQQEHVPLEVEEWLSCFVKDPVVALQEGVNDVLHVLEATSRKTEQRGYATSDTVINRKLLSPLKVMEDQLGVRIPVVGIRAAVNAPHLREKVLDDLYEYGEILAESGSTPHRRAAMEQLEKFPVSEGEIPALTSSEQATQEKEVELSPNLEKAVSAVLSPPAASAKDEKKLIEILTSFAEGCVLKNQMDEAYTTLSGALKFAHGDETRSVTHANVATSALLNGKLKEAEFHSRESALLGTAPKRTPSGKRGYALWAATVAYQDDFARAERIVDEALQLYEAAPSDVSDSSTHDTTSLRALKEKIHELGELNANMDPSLRGARKHFHADRVRGIEEGSGKSFQNEFDWVLFKNKLYPSKMNPGTNEMGSVFRRVGDLGGAISTSRSMEPL